MIALRFLRASTKTMKHHTGFMGAYDKLAVNRKGLSKEHYFLVMAIKDKSVKTHAPKSIRRVVDV